MKHVMYGEKSLLMDDESALALVEYASAIAHAGDGDTVEMDAVGDDGNEVTVTFLLNSGSVLVIESTTGKLNPPTNDEIVAIVREKTRLLRNPPSAASERPGDGGTSFDFDEYG